ncbi:hypothetical protein JW935_17200 [candidate division KSB1 bacterium]|nr:hypothetical protein [candidate division KSB1 bacterium]
METSYLLTEQEIKNYFNYRNADCVGGDPGYAPLLEWLYKTHKKTHPRVKRYSKLPFLESRKDFYSQDIIPLPCVAFLQDILNVSVGIEWWPENGLLTAWQRDALAKIYRNHNKKIFSFLGLNKLNKSQALQDIEKIYFKFYRFVKNLDSQYFRIKETLSEIHSDYTFYRYAKNSNEWIYYQDFPCSPLGTLVQSHIDCCLFNGKSRHRAATVAFLTHPATKLMAIYSEKDHKTFGATIEVDMIDESNHLVRVLDSVEIGDFRLSKTINYGWIPFVLHGFLQRAKKDLSENGSVFFNTGFEMDYNQGYLSHEAANELADWLKARFPVIRIPLRIKGGLEPLKRLGAVNPKINLEVLATKKFNNMFNNGDGYGIGVRIFLNDAEQLSKISCTQINL